MTPDEIRAIIRAATDRSTAYRTIARDIHAAHPSITASAVERAYIDERKEVLRARHESPAWNAAYDAAKIAEELLELSWRAAAEVAS